MPDNNTVHQRTEWAEWHHPRRYHLHTADDENGQVLEGTTRYLYDTEVGVGEFTASTIQET